MGVGFAVGRYFVTAGHLLDDCPAATYIKGQKFTLRKEDSLIYRSMPSSEYSPDGYDIALFELPRVFCPFHFADHEPKHSAQLTCFGYRVELSPQNGVSGVGVFAELNQEKIVPIRCEAAVDDIQGNFFGCNMNVQLKEGSSGSPLVIGDEVYGVLDAGEQGTNKCYFQSSVSIKRLMTENKIIAENLFEDPFLYAVSDFPDSLPSWETLTNTQKSILKKMGESKNSYKLNEKI